MVSIPVIGAAQTAFHVAAMLGHKFSVLASLDRRISAFEERVAKHDLDRQLASVRAVNIPVLELSDQAHVLDAVVDQSIRAVRDDGAHVIVFGCGGMAGLAKDAEAGLSEQGFPGVPVIDPAILALKTGEALADMGLSHSKRTYPTPPEKPRLWDIRGRRRPPARG